MKLRTSTPWGLTSHHMSDRAVLSCRVYPLEHEEDGVAILGVEPVLIGGEQIDTLAQKGVDVRAIDARSVIRIEVAVECDTSPGLHQKAVREILDESKPLFHHRAGTASSAFSRGHLGAMQRASMSTRPSWHSQWPCTSQ